MCSNTYLIIIEVAHTAGDHRARRQWIVQRGMICIFMRWRWFMFTIAGVFKITRIAWSDVFKFWTFIRHCRN
ncbi:hypothetical protein HanIR_Chr01g0049811 [Helianthus annuus]|nr:hypothetical protein HanIR_Chr01g0049811 [Helianthus annuus]